MAELRPTEIAVTAATFGKDRPQSAHDREQLLICSRTGAMLTFVPADEFTLEQGEQALTGYQFGGKTIHHLFCSTCGVRLFARGIKPDGSKMCAINVRCLEGVDLKALKTHEFDGRSR